MEYFAICDVTHYRNGDANWMRRESQLKLKGNIQLTKDHGQCEDSQKHYMWKKLFLECNWTSFGLGEDHVYGIWTSFIYGFTRRRWTENIFRFPCCGRSIQMFRPPTEPKPGVHAILSQGIIGKPTSRHGVFKEDDSFGQLEMLCQGWWDWRGFGVHHWLDTVNKTPHTATLGPLTQCGR